MKLTELRNQGTGSLAEDLGLTDEALRRRVQAKEASLEVRTRDGAQAQRRI